MEGAKCAACGMEFGPGEPRCPACLTTLKEEGAKYACNGCSREVNATEARCDGCAHNK